MNSEYLAITAIFVSGMYVGLKVREASYKFREFLLRKGKGAKIKFF